MRILKSPETSWNIAAQSSFLLTSISKLKLVRNYYRLSRLATGNTIKIFLSLSLQPKSTLPWLVTICLIQDLLLLVVGNIEQITASETIKPPILHIFPEGNYWITVIQVNGSDIQSDYTNWPFMSFLPTLPTGAMRTNLKLYLPEYFPFNFQFVQLTTVDQMKMTFSIRMKLR